MDNVTFAERILFGRTLEDKLAKAPPFTEAPWNTSFPMPSTPGRPKHLTMRDAADKATAPPRPDELENESSRGALLHFFANHELMATELMALALLRFQDAPVEFRRTIWSTLQDEQRHLELYLNRMKDLGVSFGDYPLGGLFWNHLSQMNSELDYVTGLCLTYEQANLDFAWDYQQVFRHLGDTRTDAVLGRVLSDEIGHVRHGIRWLREFAPDSSLDLFDTHLRYQPEALSMNAASGSSFHEGLREKAGFPRDYVDRLLSHRPMESTDARVLLFNPFAEETLAAKGEAPRSRPASESLARDLASCVWPLGQSRDIVLVRAAPPASFVADLRRAGFSPPRFCRQEELREQGSRRSLTLLPWANTPDGRNGHDIPLSNEAPTFAFTRAFDVALQKDLCVGDAARTVGRLCTNIEEVASAVLQWPDQEMVLKATLSASASNRVFARGGEPLSESTQRWATKILNWQGAILAEPWLERITDFSIQIDVDSEVHLRGQTFFSNDTKGRYLSNRIDKRPSGIPSEVQQLLGSRETKDMIEKTWRGVGDALIAEGYSGPVGIDAFVYRDNSGRPQLKSLVEANPRYTFGRVAIELRRHIPPGQPALMTILRATDVEALGAASMAHLCRQLQGERRIDSRLCGALPLTPVTLDTQWTLMLIAGPTPEGSITSRLAERVTRIAWPGSPLN